MKNVKKNLAFLMVAFLLAAITRTYAQQAPPAKTKSKAKQSSASKSNPSSSSTNTGETPVKADPQNPEEKFKLFCDRLGLNEDQRRRMNDLARESREQIERLKSERKDAPEMEKRTMLSNYLRTLEERINEILEPHQKDMFRQYKEEKRVEEMRKQEEKDRARQKNPPKKGEVVPPLPPPTNPDQLEESPF